MKILAIGFKGNISEYVIDRLKIPEDKIILFSSEKSIELLFSNKSIDSYDYILCCGSYSGVDRESIRIEKLCTSQFRNNKKNLEVINIPYL